MKCNWIYSTCFHLCFDYVADPFIYRNAKASFSWVSWGNVYKVEDIKRWGELQPVFYGSLEICEASGAVWWRDGYDTLQEDAVTVTLRWEGEWARASHIGPTFHRTAYFKVIMSILLWEQHSAPLPIWAQQLIGVLFCDVLQLRIASSLLDQWRGRDCITPVWFKVMSMITKVGQIMAAEILARDGNG